MVRMGETGEMQVMVPTDEDGDGLQRHTGEFCCCEVTGEHAGGT